MASSCATPKLIFPEDKSSADVNAYQSSSSVSSSTTDGTSNTLTRLLSSQSSFERQNPLYPIGKRFSIDADPSLILLNTLVTDLSSDPSQQSLPSDVERTTSVLTASSLTIGKETSPARSSSLNKIDSFLEIPYEKGEIVDLIKLADDPNAAAHVINDGQEVLLEHGAAPQ
jgi:hypothetical protein